MDDAELYSTRNEYHRRQAANILAEFFPKLSWTDNEVVLDIGCGPGDVTTQILLPRLPKDASLVGIDISSNMIKFAKMNYSYGNVSYKVLDFGTKEILNHFPEGHFSKIFSFSCLHWIKDIKKLVQNLHVILRPGGELLSILISGSEFNVASKQFCVLDQFREYYQNADEAIPSVDYSCEDLKESLTARGFVVHTCEERLTPFNYSSLDDATTSFEAVNSFVMEMPEMVKKEYLEHFREFARQPPSSPRLLPSGEVRILHKIIAIFARRPR